MKSGILESGFSPSPPSFPLADFKKFSNAVGIGKSAIDVIWDNSAGVLLWVNSLLRAMTSGSWSVSTAVIKFCSFQDFGKVL